MKTRAEIFRSLQDNQTMVLDIVAAYDQLRKEYDKIYAAVKYAHEQRGDDKCWMDFDKIFEAAGLPPQDKNVGDKFAMIKNCFRYVSCLTDGNWKTYEQLENENRRLKEILLSEGYKPDENGDFK